MTPEDTLWSKRPFRYRLINPVGLAVATKWIHVDSGRFTDRVLETDTSPAS
jgi:hypothetical protein